MGPHRRGAGALQECTRRIKGGRKGMVDARVGKGPRGRRRARAPSEMSFEGVQIAASLGQLKEPRFGVACHAALGRHRSGGEPVEAHASTRSAQGKDSVDRRMQSLHGRIPRMDAGDHRGTMAYVVARQQVDHLLSRVRGKGFQVVDDNGQGLGSAPHTVHATPQRDGRDHLLRRLPLRTVDDHHVKARRAQHLLHSGRLAASRGAVHAHGAVTRCG